LQSPLQTAATIESTTTEQVCSASRAIVISALARASRVLDEPRYLEAATRAQTLIKTKLYQPATGKVMRRYRFGNVGIDGYLDDYAWAIRGSLDLYEASFDTHLLSWAVKLQRKQDDLFWDKKQGGYFTTTGADKSLLWRSREVYDGAEPSASSVSALNLIWIWQLTDDKGWKDKVDKTLSASSSQLEKAPEASPLLAAALDLQISKHRQIVIAGSPDASDTGAMLDLVWHRFLPDAILFLADGSKGQRELAHYLPVVANMTRKQGKATAFICENYVCKLPTTDPKLAERLLDSGK
jgi:uncharacterized protein YyaL (SSP411 family)